MKLLLHTCCAPCSIYPLQRLKEKDFAVTAYFYNPNIHPYKEFKKRLATLREYLLGEKVPLIVNKEYELEEFLQGQLTAPNSRCHYCYETRFRTAAIFAKENNFTAFSTTLLVSPFQNHELIKNIATKVSEAIGIEFYYEDFRNGFETSTTISKEREMYRQNYCGCIFSERDRFKKK